MAVAVSRVRGLLFDVFGTVVDWRTGVASQVEAQMAQWDLEIDAEAFADAWRARYQPSMEPIRAGKRAYVRLDVLHRENLDWVLDAFGLGAALDEAQRDIITGVWERLPPWPDCQTGLAHLKAHHILAPCSNGSIGLMARLARFGGLSWDAILGADLARNYKPRPEVYQVSVEHLGLEPDEVIMVAAHNDDLAAAQKLGLGTAFVCRPREYGPRQSTDLEPTGDWDLVVEDLSELARRLV